jgi:hypothetical protein
MTVGQPILPAAGFQPDGPAGKRVRSQDWLPHRSLETVNNWLGQHY